MSTNVMALYGVSIFFAFWFWWRKYTYLGPHKSPLLLQWDYKSQRLTGMTAPMTTDFFDCTPGLPSNKYITCKRHLKYDTNYKQYENRFGLFAVPDEGPSLVRKFAQCFQVAVSIKCMPILMHQNLPSTCRRTGLDWNIILFHPFSMQYLPSMT
jgi:hypothetical protein